MPSVLNPSASLPVTALKRTRMPAIALSDLGTPEGRQALAEAVIVHGGIRPGCRALGLDAGTVYGHMYRDPELAAIVRSARSTLAEQLLERIKELEDLMLNLKGGDRTNERISAIREVLHSLRWRISKTNVNYGERPASVTNIQTNVGVVCDEKTRAQLIALREQIKAPPAEITSEEGRGYTFEIEDAEPAHETES